MLRRNTAGHARVYVAFDVIYRFLRHLGYEASAARAGLSLWTALWRRRKR